MWGLFGAPVSLRPCTKSLEIIRLDTSCVSVILYIIVSIEVAIIKFRKNKENSLYSKALLVIRAYVGVYVHGPCTLTGTHVP